MCIHPPVPLPPTPQTQRARAPPQAFKKLPQEVVDSLVAYPDRLKGLILSHVVSCGGTCPRAAALINGQPIKTLGLSGSTPEVVSNVAGGSVTFVSGPSTAGVVKADVLARNGVVHVIDTVLIPDCIPTTPGSGNVVQALQSDCDARFTTLLTAVGKAGLTEAIKGSQCPAKFPFTVANADGGLEEGKLCWKDAAAKDKSCDGWCLKPEHAAADPGGHLAACKKLGRDNVCKGVVGLTIFAPTNEAFSKVRRPKRARQLNEAQWRPIRFRLALRTYAPRPMPHGGASYVW